MTYSFYSRVEEFVSLCMHATNWASDWRVTGLDGLSGEGDIGGSRGENPGCTILDELATRGGR
jgi:hypothetical protein